MNYKKLLLNLSLLILAGAFSKLNCMSKEQQCLCEISVLEKALEKLKTEKATAWAHNDFVSTIGVCEYEALGGEVSSIDLGSFYRREEEIERKLRVLKASLSS